MSCSSLSSLRRIALAGVAALLVAACGGPRNDPAQSNIPLEFQPRYDDKTGTTRESIFDLFALQDDPNTTLEVNRYLWTAALDVLNFLPIETVDPFSGVIVTGYGVPPGGGQSYRATVYVREPALAARSLRVALATRSGPVSADTVRAVEDAILTRARQLRIQDGQL